jgi:hypothetical protein
MGLSPAVRVSRPLKARAFHTGVESKPTFMLGTIQYFPDLV